MNKRVDLLRFNQFCIFLHLMAVNDQIIISGNWQCHDGTFKSRNDLTQQRSWRLLTISCLSVITIHCLREEKQTEPWQKLTKLNQELHAT